ncbi:hypothetical protein GCM10010123_20120 [Pilimelia anulata]|uniref:Pentapeptide repeat-containing protein n=1 Tax=Pilimelia anulata TaxID=53371 RepID=A0A8J3F8W7_9ACTN|nr:pentapeptide repeat-containing protein [Pilimelia anulata]GGJ90291.1 hypothetical protein GCM10010123_20120 [Pilimelia anulata]
MVVRSPRRGVTRWQPPQPPTVPAALTRAVLPDHDLDHEVSFDRVEFDGLDLTGRRAGGVQFEECRLARTNLAETVLDRSQFSECVAEQANWANLKATKSTLLRCRLSGLRLTGLHWVDGGLRDVTIAECRVDLASFRFSSFSAVLFEDCVLTGADFTGAKLGGARFVGCDLTGARFPEAQLKGAEFSRCTLADIDGITNFAGAVIDSHDLIALSYTLAGALGIQIRG